MTDEKKLEQAKAVYQTLCNAAENIGIHFGKDEENLTIFFGMSGEDVPMRMFITVYADVQIVKLISSLPFKMDEDKRIEGAIAASAASFSMLNGGFSCDLSNGDILFEMNSTFRGSELGEGLFHYMIGCSCAMVEKYNDRFLALNKGEIGVEAFIDG